MPTKEHRHIPPASTTINYTQTPANEKLFGFRFVVGFFVGFLGGQVASLVILLLAHEHIV